MPHALSQDVGRGRFAPVMPRARRLRSRVSRNEHSIRRWRKSALGKQVPLKRNDEEGLGGWIVVYVIGSIPLLTIYSMGLSGWFFEYPVGLMLAIFVLLAVPLLLVLRKSPKAPRWNIAALWIMAALMILRSISVILFPMSSDDAPPLRGDELLAVVQPLGVIVAVALGWALVWTRYFRNSVRVRSTFRQKTSCSG